jgi:hypothetical protein
MPDDPSTVTGALIVTVGKGALAQPKEALVALRAANPSSPPCIAFLGPLAQHLKSRNISNLGRSCTQNILTFINSACRFKPAARAGVIAIDELPPIIFKTFPNT